ncbi:MAG: hypothetical protein K0S86_1045 [Geminicoccaceae bacterium]|jgi:hypothetical protein|nr:hypothetical protein [Geminicoccaceae bacterium]
MSPQFTETEPHETVEHGTGEAISAARRHDAEALMHVRSSDIEPYIGLRYLSKLFRFMAIILVLLLVAEVITGFVQQGRAAIPTLLGEMSRLIVLAGLLWGTGDLAILLIDVGHDVRATRILMGRQIAHHVVADHPHADESPPAADTAPHRRSTEIRTR